MKVGEAPWCAIIHGMGKSSRMGHPKHKLPFDGSRTFLEAILDVYGEVCESVIVAVPDDAPLPSKFRRVEIESPDPSYTILKLLHEVPPYHNVFIQPVDMPFVSIPILKKIMRMCEGWDAVIPVYMWRTGHPIAITYPAIESIKLYLGVGLTLRDAIYSVKFRMVDVDTPATLVNINDPEIYRHHITIYES